MSTKNKTKNNFFIWVKALIIVFILLFFIRSFGVATSIVKGESMMPTLEDGERVLFNRFIYLVSEPSRGDIIIISRPESNYVKRVIGLPNETIEMKDEVLYIDGVAQDTTFVDEASTKLTGDFDPVTLEDDSYFVMGDNRGNSKDSRNSLGYIDREYIIGRAELIIYPFEKLELLK